MGISITNVLKTAPTYPDQAPARVTPGHALIMDQDQEDSRQPFVDYLQEKRKQEQRQQEAAALIVDIVDALERGTGAPSVLMAAVRCIGLLAPDAETWQKTEQAHDILQARYGDLEQQALFGDNTSKELARLQAARSDRNRKLLARISKEQKQVQKEADQLLALQAILALEQGGNDNEKA